MRIILIPTQYNKKICFNFNLNKVELFQDWGEYMEDNRKLLGIYFSGTGNSKYCLSEFLKGTQCEYSIYSIEDKEIVNKLKEYEEIIFSYPVQYSDIPKIVRDFVDKHKLLWLNKKIFIIATMALFSGDGSGILARRLQKYGAEITGGLHLMMPDSICDERILNRSFKRNKALIEKAKNKTRKAAKRYLDGRSPQEGLNFISRLLGLLSQRLWFSLKTKTYAHKLKIHRESCIGCEKCVKLCPLQNIRMEKDKAVSGFKCTICYRCVSHCPSLAITLLGKKVIAQRRVEKYL